MNFQFFWKNAKILKETWCQSGAVIGKMDSRRFGPFGMVAAGPTHNRRLLSARAQNQTPLLICKSKQLTFLSADKDLLLKRILGKKYCYLLNRVPGTKVRANSTLLANERGFSLKSSFS